MRTATLNLYKFKELSEETQAQLIEKNKWNYYDCMAEYDWRDIKESINRLKEFAGVKFWMESSSQGNYYRNAVLDDPEYKFWGRKNEDLLYLRDLKKRMRKEWKEELWCDSDIKEAILGIKEERLKEYNGYASVVASAMASMCDRAESDMLHYVDDTSEIANYLEEKECEYLEDGTLYSYEV